MTPEREAEIRRWVAEARPRYMLVERDLLAALDAEREARQRAERCVVEVARMMGGEPLPTASEVPELVRAMLSFLRADVERLTRERNEARASERVADLLGRLLQERNQQLVEERRLRAESAAQWATQEAQGLEGALAATERERDAARAEIERLTRERDKARAEVSALELRLCGAVDLLGGLLKERTEERDEALGRFAQYLGDAAVVSPEDEQALLREWRATKPCGYTIDPGSSCALPDGHEGEHSVRMEGKK